MLEERIIDKGIKFRKPDALDDKYKKMIEGVVKKHIPDPLIFSDILGCLDYVEFEKLVAVLNNRIIDEKRVMAISVFINFIAANGETFLNLRAMPRWWIICITESELDYHVSISYLQKWEDCESFNIIKK